MKLSKQSIIIGLLVIAAGAAALVGGLIYKQQSDASSKQAQVTASSRPAPNPHKVYVPGLPVRLIIPKISVDAKIDSLGLTPDGDLDDPEDITNAGWYNAGPRAGSIGSAVMDGHFGGTKSKPAVFDNLHTLQIGDRINVVDSDKTIHVYAVTNKKTFQPEEDATEVFRSNDNKAHLNLITCQGDWISQKESYSTRLVIFTELLSEE